MSTPTIGNVLNAMQDIGTTVSGKNQGIIVSARYDQVITTVISGISFVMELSSLIRRIRIGPVIGFDGTLLRIDLYTKKDPHK